ncbi:hypothetical protein ADU72_0773 [Pediococcus damnosus]|uniref:DUF4868 domain-containing protein n=1 Tax=Pediococcus damnosus TaxID=51663 RepID=A0A0R2HHI6_9LACO|nr:hypothetical protein [Pediococcus damnosus]AMV60789.1 hypothetical protein ADU69_1130 [Pediococcus damnosus]AMV63377.1 hypothetical protein ADU70_1911 [Pediococcus damnosus]AMV65100.1 hypothetical protein ADU71_1204 [Pediococcus damnosus]AMV66718.1 hypothetical protein ADU72_0773 [Pediococcus damnosus]AMV69914.1 hypothetical protein ADU73_1522 [Pediococcus damnosus]
MDSVLYDLEFAKNDQRLANVFPKEQETFYTGFVNSIGADGVILNTYDDTGQADGAVYVQFDAIENVEFDSPDLDNMLETIQIAENDQLFTVMDRIPDFVSTSDLIKQVVEDAYKNEQFLVLTRSDLENYQEGKVTAVHENDFEMHLVDKFDLTHEVLTTIKYTEAEIVEFSGRELAVETATWPEIAKQQPESRLTLTDTKDFYAVLKNAEQKQELITINDETKSSNFFVGTVNAVNKSEVLCNLVDMAGQFGGYSLIRLDAIVSITLKSDYMQVMEAFINYQKKNQTFVQPVLNEERLFDATDDLIMALIKQTETFSRVLSISLLTGAREMGYITDVTTDTFRFHVIDADLYVDQTGIEIVIEDVDELSFDFLNAVLIENHLRDKGLL